MHVIMVTETVLVFLLMSRLGFVLVLLFKNLKLLGFSLSVNSKSGALCFVTKFRLSVIAKIRFKVCMHILTCERNHHSATTRVNTSKLDS